MKNFIGLLLVLIFVFSVFASWGIAQQDEEIPPGMEVIKIGDARTIVIKGTKIKKKGDLLIVEGTKEFVARKFLETDRAFSEMQTMEDKIQKEIEQLKRELEELKDRVHSVEMDR